MARLARPGLLASLVLAGLIFGCDGTTFALQAPDPARGRRSGCYTLLDDLFGTTQPSDPLRSVELGLSLALLGAAAAIVYAGRRRASYLHAPPSA